MVSPTALVWVTSETARSKSKERRLARRDLWYKEAIVYALSVETFLDANGDGIGDFKGLTQRLDHLSTLGVNCIWLLPFYPSPNRDDGYDVCDHYGIDPRYGSAGDFVEFVREAHLRGLRVVVDLVVNHTSDQHPWFKAARADPKSPYREYYIFRDKPVDNPKIEQVVYAHQDHSPWTYDDEAQAYYFHRFYPFEPELNTNNPAVRQEIEKIIQYWITLGADGFRIDAAPYLGDTIDDRERSAHPHEVLRRIRDYASAIEGDIALMAEADVKPELLPNYVGDGHEIHMLFNFYLNNFLFLALAREQAEPIIRAYKNLPDLPNVGQWLNWVRNHDELDLEQLSKSEREEVFRAFAPQKDMRIYNRGIRRRFPPMVSGDRKRMEMTYSLMLSLPGTPVLRTGEEIGMGDDLDLPERWSVRTPMQWSDDTNGGFSTADPDKLMRPVISDGPFGYEKVNVVDQRLDPGSFLSWITRAIGTRRRCPEWGWGQFASIGTDQQAVLAHTASWDNGHLMALHNFSGKELTVNLDGGLVDQHRCVELMSDQSYDKPQKGQTRFKLGPYGYRWFRLDGSLR